MHLSGLLRIIIKIPGRAPQWREISENRLPPGYKIFDYSPKYYGSIIMISGLCCYIYAQSSINPDSIWGKGYSEFFERAGQLSSYFTQTDESNVTEAN